MSRTINSLDSPFTHEYIMTFLNVPIFSFTHTPPGGPTPVLGAHMYICDTVAKCLYLIHVIAFHLPYSTVTS